MYTQVRYTFFVARPKPRSREGIKSSHILAPIFELQLVESKGIVQPLKERPGKVLEVLVTDDARRGPAFGWGFTCGCANPYPAAGRLKANLCQPVSGSRPVKSESANRDRFL